MPTTCCWQPIPQMYADAYLTQQDRPEGMAYFDFVLSEIHGLRIKELAGP